MYQQNYDDLIKRYQEAIDRELSRPQSRVPGVKFLYPHNPGTYIVRILPNRDYINNPIFFVRAYYHVQVDPSGEKIAQVICRRQTFNEDCAICDVLDTLTREVPDHPITQTIKTITRKRVLTYFNAIFKGFIREGSTTVQDTIREDDGSEIHAGDIVILTLPITVAESLLREVRVDPVGTIFPETGRDYKVNNMKISGRTTYSGSFDYRPSPVQNWEEIKEQMYDLDAILKRKLIGKEDAFRTFYGGLMMNKEVANAVKRVALHGNIVGSEVFEQLPSAESSQPQVGPKPYIPTYEEPKSDIKVIQPEPIRYQPTAPKDTEITTPPPPLPQTPWTPTEPKSTKKLGLGDILKQLEEE